MRCRPEAGALRMRPDRITGVAVNGEAAIAVRSFLSRLEYSHFFERYAPESGQSSSIIAADRYKKLIVCGEEVI